MSKAILILRLKRVHFTNLISINEVDSDKIVVSDKVS